MLLLAIALNLQSQLHAQQTGRRPQAAPSGATLLLPVAVAYDSTGNLFFADAKRNQVFELTLAGELSVVAGTGEQGFDGDGGSATAALLNGPRGVAVGSDGTIYIADTGNQRVRALHAGLITTLAGNGSRGFSGDGPAMQAAFSVPTALAIDGSGAVLVCDTGNDRVRRITGGQISTFAGNGVQGFAGDGGLATAAELDTPLGVAVSHDGGVLIADTHNHWVRMVQIDGTMITVAGTGVGGYAGDGGAAQNAVLDLPYGVAVGADGSLLVADAGNQRIRSISGSGIMTTLVGSGVQGVSPEGTASASAALNSPRAVTENTLNQPVLADASNATVRELASDNALYTLALLASPHLSQVALSVANAVYGTASALVQVTSSPAAAEGSVSISESGAVVGTAALDASSATLPLTTLGAGAHKLLVSYSGDGLHAAASATAIPVSIGQAPITAVANAASMLYGDVVPVLSGTLSGVLPQDAASVRGSFTSQVTRTSSPGVYPIGVALTGPGSDNYALAIGAQSGSLTVTQALSITTLSPPGSTYTGLPLLLSATVVTTTSGVPTGEVDFFEDSSLLASGSAVNGIASAVVTPLAQGTHSYAATYRGNTNFLPSNSKPASVSVAGMPDFTISPTTSAQSVQGGGVAAFSVAISPQNGAFTGVVGLSVSGLPRGATASFAPPAMVPGAGSVTSTLSVQTIARSGQVEDARKKYELACLPFLGLVALAKRKRRRMPTLLALACCTALASSGCGTRSTGAESSSGQTYMLTITGTGTNLAGSTLTHASTVSLTVF